MPDYLDHPFHFDGRGRAAVTGIDDHVRDMIYQVLFTSPGERVNRPDFGCGLLQLVFAPNSNALAATTQFMVQSALQRWLGDVIEVEDVTVLNLDSTLLNLDSTLEVTVVYRRRDNGQLEEARFTAPS